MKKVIYSLALVLMLTITALCVTACGGGGAIKLNKTSTTLVEGQSETLVATLEGVEGTVVWQSDEPSVAMVNGYGLVTAIKEGTANITAKVGGETATCVVTVVLEKSVTLDKDTVSVSLFEDVKLNASVKNLTGSVIWSSSDESVATVTNNGLVVAKKAGTVTITATVDGKSDSCQIEFNAVDANDVLAIENEIDTYSLYMDAQAKIQPYVVMNNQTEINGAEYTFVSSDPAIAQVLDDGTIQPVSFGQTTITISGTVKGVQLVSKQVTVIIKERLIVSTGYTGENLLLYQIGSVV